MPKPSDFLTVREVAQVLTLSTQRVYQLISSGKLPAIRFGKNQTVILVQTDTVQECLALHKRPKNAPQHPD